MQSFKGSQKAHWLEKVFRIAIPALLIYGGIKLFNSEIAPTLISFFKNIWVLLGIGIPLVALVLYVVSNPSFIWMTYKNLCRKLTSFLVKLDFLSYLDSYVDILKTKRANLQKSKQNLTGKKVQLERQMNELLNGEGGFKQLMQKAKASMDLQDKEAAAHYSGLAQGNKQTLEVYQPILMRMKKNIEFLDKLDENWGYSIEKLEHEVKRKRQEYETMREMAKALGQAEEFAKGNTESAKIFHMSMNALEESLSQKIAAIEEFEKNSKSIMSGIDLEKKMIENEGLDLLEQYMSDGKLMLPDSYENITVIEPLEDNRIKKSASTGKGNNGNADEFSTFLNK